jgi:hypothetical protein
MGYVKIQADNALKAGNYKDAYTKCVMTLLARSTLSASFGLSCLCLPKKKKKCRVSDLFRVHAGTLTVWTSFHEGTKNPSRCTRIDR